MNWKRKNSIYFFVVLFVAFFLFPTVGHAVDYSITNVNIDATLKENGQVTVIETHTYSFDGEFNGITREIVPKDGSSITKFYATENGDALKVEQEGHLYKIHREGKNEEITITIFYTIENGVTIYSDVAEFYWPFFDKRNRSTYENLTIVIRPPHATNDVLAFGYDEAFATEEIHSDGSVLYKLGEVSSKRNGDIRVAYSPELFPVASLTANKMMKNEIINAKQGLLEKAAAKAETRDTLAMIALIIVPTFTILLLLFIFGAIYRARLKKLDIERKVYQAFFVPKEVLSLPATILFTNGMLNFSAEVMSAALLDLVRKGYISRTKENLFTLENKSYPLLEHEKILIALLFEEVGSGTQFSFGDLKDYTDKKSNHEKFQSHMLKWQQAIHKEIKENKLYENNKKLRWMLAILGILLVPFSFLFPADQLFGWLIATVILIISYIVFAITYTPKTSNGLMIVKEWHSVKERLQKVSQKEWEELTTDEQMRAYIYGIGINDKNLIKKNKELIESFQQRHNKQDNDWNSATVDLNTMLLIGPLASSNFQTAYTITQESTSSSSSSSSGGTGGGGGGSGAF